MSRWADLFFASPKGPDNGDSGDNGAANRASVTNVPTVTLPRVAEGDVSPPASVTNVTIVNTYATIAPGNEEAAEFARDATEGSISGGLTDGVPSHQTRESEPVTVVTMVTVGEGQELLLRPSPDRCAGCGELVGDDRFYEYEGGYRCHADPECLIAWNAKWHAAEGREYDAAFYRQNLIPDGVMESGPKRPAHAEAPAAQWSERIGHLDPDRPRVDVPLNRWRQFIADARRLLDEGIVAGAAELGWGVFDLFGCADTKPRARLDQMGLAWFINGGRIVSISMSAALIETPTGARQTYRRKDGAPGRVLVWELFGEGSHHIRDE